LNLLLDTHTFLWFIAGDPRLSSTARTLIEDPENDRALSIASLWEMSIKISIGRLNLKVTFKTLVQDHIKKNAISLLPVLPEHLDSLLALPFHHKDPFDRLIISQGITDNRTILSRDEVFDRYEGIVRCW
jgi:PIN domain nuclease of toxin-antitoxin system